MRLYDLISETRTFSIMDEKKGKVISFEDLPAVLLYETTRSLIFIYSDNSFEDVSFFLKTLETEHVLALLPSSMDTSLKVRLESIYMPKYVYDRKRIVIEGYSMGRGDIFQFKSNRNDSIILHKDLRLLLSTSGTTGSPKFVKLSESNLIANAVSICKYLPINKSDIAPLNLPIHYSYGLSILTSHAIAGASVSCIENDILNRGFWMSFSKNGYTSLAGVPFMYETLKRIGFLKFELPGLRYLTQAGGRLRDELIVSFCEYANRFGKSFYVMYGQTEATARMSYLPPELALSKLGSVGIAIPGGRFEIDSESEELMYYGENVFGGYAERLDDLASFDKNEILRTGDLAYFDNDGYLYIKGRVKRIVKLYGNRVNLDEVEAAITNRFNFLMPCLGWNDVYLLIFHEDLPIAIPPVIRYVGEKFRINYNSIRTVFVKEFPTNANGKIDYNKLLERYEAR